MSALHPLPRPAFNPLEWEGEENATRTRLPIPDGLIAAVPLRLAALNFRRIYAGTFGPLAISSFQDHVRQFANFLHVSVSFVSLRHVQQHDGRDRACPTSDVSRATQSMTQRS